MSPWGPSTAILFILALGVGLVLLVWAVFAIFPTVTRVVTQSFWFPFRKWNVTVEFQDCLRLEELPSVSGSVRAA